jgi:aryl-alcohol dehydrogenase-like predicted oxidoreductase
MKNLFLKKHGLDVSRLVYGCMSFGGDSNTNENERIAERAVDTALSIGINFFDLADIYKRGNAEKLFGQTLKKNPSLRDQMVIQSKCGVRFEDDAGPKRFDFSQEHILHSVEGILKRLGIEY